MLLIIVHRLLQSFLFPPLNAMFIMLIGLIILKFYKRTGVIIIIFAWVFLYLQSLPRSAYLLNKIYELPPLTYSEFESSEAIVILGNGINKNGPEYPLGVNVSSGTAIRLNYAVFLAKQDPQKLIVVSGGYTGNLREANVMKDWLINIYDIKNPIIMENKSRNTDENAKFVAEILLNLHIKNVVIITQAYHMRRAMMLFNKYGLNPVAGSTDYFSSFSAQTPALAFIPSAVAMDQVTIVYHELIGYWLYKYFD